MIATILTIKVIFRYIKYKSFYDAINNFNFLKWLFEDNAEILLGFFSFLAGAFLVLYSEIGGLIILQMVLMFTFNAVLFAVFIRSRERERTKIADMPVQPRMPTPNYGIVYIMRRSDGVLKFGKTQYLRNRIAAHRSDYAADFGMVAAWVVPDIHSYESHALGLSHKYHFCEGNRKELRMMTDTELSEFVTTFTEKVHNGFKET